MLGLREHSGDDKEELKKMFIRSHFICWGFELTGAKYLTQRKTQNVIEIQIFETFVNKSLISQEQSQNMSGANLILT